MGSGKVLNLGRGARRAAADVPYLSSSIAVNLACISMFDGTTHLEIKSLQCFMTMDDDVDLKSIFKPMGRGVGDQGPCIWTYDVTTGDSYCTGLTNSQSTNCKCTLDCSLSSYSSV